jgi:hypothetical protein
MGFEDWHLIRLFPGGVEVQASPRASETGLFEIAEIGERRIELVLEVAHVAAKEVEAMAGAQRFLPGFDDETDAVDAFHDFVGVDAGLHVEDAGFHHDEAFETPIEVGDFFDEAEFAFRCRAEIVDEGVADFGVFVGELGGEEGVFVGGESEADGVLGGFGLAFGGDWALGFTAVDAGLFGALFLWS